RRDAGPPARTAGRGQNRSRTPPAASRAIPTQPLVQRPTARRSDPPTVGPYHSYGRQPPVHRSAVARTCFRVYRFIRAAPEQDSQRADLIIIVREATQLTAPR